MNLALLLVVLCLADARMTRVVVADTITSGLRYRWFRRFPPSGRHAHPLGELVDCQWCVAWWGAGIAVLIASQFASLPLPLVWWPAVAEGASLMTKWLDG